MFLRRICVYGQENGEKRACTNCRRRRRRVFDVFPVNNGTSRTGGGIRTVIVVCATAAAGFSILAHKN